MLLSGCGNNGVVDPIEENESHPPYENGSEIDPIIDSTTCNTGIDTMDDSTIDSESVFNLKINFELKKEPRIQTLPSGKDTTVYVETSQLYSTKFAVLVIDEDNPLNYYPIYIQWQRGDTTFSITSKLKFLRYSVTFLDDISNLCSVTPSNSLSYATNMVDNIVYNDIKIGYRPGDDAISIHDLTSGESEFTITWF